MPKVICGGIKASKLRTTTGVILPEKINGRQLSEEERYCHGVLGLEPFTKDTRLVLFVGQNCIPGCFSSFPEHSVKILDAQSGRDSVDVIDYICCDDGLEGIAIPGYFGNDVNLPGDSGLRLLHESEIIDNPYFRRPDYTFIVSNDGGKTFRFLQYKNEVLVELDEIGWRTKIVYGFEYRKKEYLKIESIEDQVNSRLYGERY